METNPNLESFNNQPRSKLAVWSFILSFLPVFLVIMYSLFFGYPEGYMGMFAFLFIIGLMTPIQIIALILSIISLRRIKNFNLKGRGLAISALIISILLLIIESIALFISVSGSMVRSTPPR